MLAAAVLLEGQRLSIGQLAGLLLGSAGVALTAAGDLRAGVRITALVLPLSAMLSLTAGTLLQRRWSTSSRRPTPLMQTLAVQAVCGAVLFTAYALAAGTLVPPSTAAFWAATGWAVLAGIGSYGLYYLVSTRDGAARASPTLYLTPAATALWAALMFGQPIRPTTVLDCWSARLPSSCSPPPVRPEPARPARRRSRSRKPFPGDLESPSRRRVGPTGVAKPGQAVWLGPHRT